MGSRATGDHQDPTDVAESDLADPGNVLGQHDPPGPTLSGPASLGASGVGVEGCGQPARPRIEITNDTVDHGDIDDLIRWLKSYPRLTKGPETLAFEREWSESIGTAHSTFCNSGSSANLIALASLLYSGLIEPGAEIVVPALCWATDLAPVIQLGFKPILCDCNLDDLSLDLHALRQILDARGSISAVMLVSVLGMPPDMLDLKALVEAHNLLLIEDACEALGSTYDGQPIGSFGDVSTFSFYWGHQMSTIEGGMMCTDDPAIAEVARSIRSHGWGRDFEQTPRLGGKLNEPYTFYYPGYNLRSTDLQAFIGTRQLWKLPAMAQVRDENFTQYLDRMAAARLWRPKLVPLAETVSCFGYPIISPNREKIQAALADDGIDSRPLMSGNIAMHPAYRAHFRGRAFSNATQVREHGFYVPCHPGLDEAQINRICDIIVNTK